MMKRVTGIGGIFIKSADTARLRDWYQKHLGIDDRSLGRHRVSLGRPSQPGWSWHDGLEHLRGVVRLLQSEPGAVHGELPRRQAGSAARGVARGRLPGRRTRWMSPSTASSAGWSIPTATRSNCGSRRKGSSHDRERGCAEFFRLDPGDLRQVPRAADLRTLRHRPRATRRGAAAHQCARARSRHRRGHAPPGDGAAGQRVHHRDGSAPADAGSGRRGGNQPAGRMAPGGCARVAVSTRPVSMPWCASSASCSLRTGRAPSPRCVAC